jgi:hypothetical protein
MFVSAELVCVAVRTQVSIPKGPSSNLDRGDFICGLFKNAFSISDQTASNGSFIN